MPVAKPEEDRAEDLGCLSLQAQKQNVKQTVRKITALSKAQHLLEESIAVASIDPSRSLSCQYADFVARAHDGNSTSLLMVPPKRHITTRGQYIYYLLCGVSL